MFAKWGIYSSDIFNDSKNMDDVITHSLTFLSQCRLKIDFGSIILPQSEIGCGECITWIDGLLRWPKFDVVCLGSWPKTIMLALINLKASMTTCEKATQKEHKTFSSSWLPCLQHFKKKMTNYKEITHLSFDTLDGIHHHCNSSLRQGFKALLCVDVNTWQPTAKTRVTVVPPYHHLWSEDQQREKMF